MKDDNAKKHPWINRPYVVLIDSLCALCCFFLAIFAVKSFCILHDEKTLTSRYAKKNRANKAERAHRKSPHKWPFPHIRSNMEPASEMESYAAEPKRAAPGGGSRRH
jgi:hypothetical protein